MTKRSLFIRGMLMAGLLVLAVSGGYFLRNGAASVVTVDGPGPYVVPFVVSWDLTNTGYDSNPRCEVWDPRGTDAMIASFNGVTGSYTVSEPGVSFVLRCFKGTQYFNDLMPMGIAPSDSTPTTGESGGGSSAGTQAFSAGTTVYPTQDCGDGTDNDGDGYADSLDPGCQAGGTAEAGDVCKKPNILMYSLQPAGSSPNYEARNTTNINAVTGLGFTPDFSNRQSQPTITSSFLNAYDVVWFFNGCGGATGIPTSAELTAIRDFYLNGGHLIMTVDDANGDAAAPGDCYSRVNAISQNLGVSFSGTLSDTSGPPYCRNATAAHSIAAGVTQMQRYSATNLSITGNVAWGQTQPTAAVNIQSDGKTAVALTPREGTHGAVIFQSEYGNTTSCGGQFDKNMFAYMGFKPNCVTIAGSNSAASSVGGSSVAGALPAGSIRGPSVCDTVCGDGIKAGDELCDDGNAINTDACNNNCGRVPSSSSSSSFNFSSSSSSVMTCIPGTICPTGDLCPLNGVCPTASSSSSVMTCIPGTICPTGGLCPQNGFCPQASSSSSAISCIPGTVCPTGDICPQNGLCPYVNSSSSSVTSAESSQGIESCTVNADCPSNLCLGGFCSCTGSEQCGGDACVGGFCSNVAAISTTSDTMAFAACQSALDCPAGMLCQDGNCAPDLALCGNGIADAGEVCDDGNDVDIDGCTATCLLSDSAACGNPRQCRSLICKDGVCTPCVSDNECPDDMACVEGACSAVDTVNPIDPDNDGMVVLSDGYKIAASLFSQLGSDVRPESLSYDHYLELMQQHAAGHAPVGNTGPESVAVIAAGASAGYAWMKMRKIKKGAR